MKNEILKHYAPRVHPERDSHDILDWSSAQEQRLRFAVLLRLCRQFQLLPPPGAEAENPAAPLPTLLDVGCGLADLRLFLAEQGAKVDYTGVDITPEVLAEARRRQPDALLLHGDVFADPAFPGKKFDIVFASGIFNLNLGNNDDFVPAAIQRLHDLSKRLFAVNFLNVSATPRYAQCWYTTPVQILNALPAAMRTAAHVINDYLPKDFTLCFPIVPR